MDGSLPCQNGIAKHRQTRWRHRGTGASPPEPAAPQPGMPHPPRMLPAWPGDSDAHGSYEMDGMPSWCVYVHSVLRKTQFFNHNAYAQDGKRNKDFIPDFLSTLTAVWKYGWHSFWRWVQPFEWIEEWSWALIKRNRIFVYYHYIQLADTLKYILKDIFICTIEEWCSNEGKHTWWG